jgi:hypothetical protein
MSSTPGGCHRAAHLGLNEKDRHSAREILMTTTIDLVAALLPIVTLFVGFLVFKMTAFKTSFYAWILELVVVLAYYHQAPLKVIEGSLWGIVTIWSGFLVLYTGQIFGQAYRSTGLLAVLLESVGSIVPAHDKEAKALALVVVIGGFIGAFNGFAVYPVAFPGSWRWVSTACPRSPAFLSIFPGLRPLSACLSCPTSRTWQPTSRSPTSSARLDLWPSRSILSRCLAS